jgi:exopolysaccharide biosynthesis polyprenyl glycosylphosphotransferase
MDTLQGRDTTLIAVPKERERTESISPALDRGHHSSPLTRLPELSGKTTQDGTPIEYFASDFHHPLFPVKDVPYAGTKRVFDLFVASSMILLTLPVMLITAIAIKLTSRGPVFFKQIRVGRGGRYFWCYKFRSMCIDADAQKDKLMHLNEASGPVFKIKNDPRVTPIGGIIRKLSIDELPQFFNVIKGEMSVVGPRPPVPREVNEYTAYERGRLAVKPGITCLWQVSGRSNISFERWVQLDLDYIETMSLSNDFKILIRTVPAVLKGSGAH